MATSRVWFYKGLPTLQSRAYETTQPILEEPFLSTETVTSGGSAAASSEAPAGTDVAVVLPDAAVYYLVRGPGVTTDADSTCRQVAANTEAVIHVKPHGTISFLDV